jgi:integrase
MSNNTLNAALRRLGDGRDEMTAHGFRSMASTLLNELGWSTDAVERQLPHGERDGVRAVYNYAQYLPERRLIQTDWMAAGTGTCGGNKSARTRSP